MNSQSNKVAIIGGGPAGLSAAIYTSRADLAPVLYAGSPPGGQLMLTSEVENYPGYPNILGPNLIDIFRKQAEKFDTKIIDENISSVDFTKNPFTLNYSDKTVTANSVIIATGAKALWLNLPSEQRLRGKGVSACATCDGFFFKDKVVAVVGGGDTAMEEAQTLTKFAKLVYIIHRRDSFRASQIMQARVKGNSVIKIIWNASIEEVLGKDKVEGLKIKNQKSEISNLTIDGLFIAIGHKPDTGLFKDKIILDEKGYIVTSTFAAIRAARSKELDLDKFNFNYQTMTSIPGVFAAGDCVDHIYRQAGTASGMGIAAALDAERWIMENKSIS